MIRMIVSIVTGAYASESKFSEQLNDVVGGSVERD